MESRKPDAERILIRLGFSPEEGDDILSKIPDRFLKHSRVKGNDTEEFISRQVKANNVYEETMLGFRGLTGDPNVIPSKIVSAILERFQEYDNYLDNEDRYFASLPPD